MSFSEIMGQETAKSFLKQVIAREKISHAYLFTGIPGVGRTSTAMALAMALNCREPIDFNSCGQCPSCRQMMGGNYPDFLFIKPEGQNIKIEQIRDLNRSISFAPVSGKFRVCVIHQAETMTDEAANSFLKTLEEPPPGNILILKVTEPLDLLPTIVSRCQKVTFQPLNVQDITNWLIKKRDLNEETAMLLARISSGSLGRALRMCESDFMEKREAWLSRLIELPGLSKDKALDLALECADENKKKDLGIPESGMDMLTVWENWYRDLLLVRAGGSTDLLINVDFSHKLRNIAEGFEIDHLIASIVAVDQAQWDMRRMRNVTLVMEHLVFSLNRLAGARN